jgi:hypothetical protein
MRLVTERGRRASMVVVADGSPTGDELLDRALKTIQARSKLTAERAAETSADRCASAYRERLEAVGLLEAKKARGFRSMLSAVFWETTRTRVLLTDGTVTMPIHARISGALEDPERAELRTVALIGVLSHSASLSPVVLKDAANLVVSTGRRQTPVRKLEVAKQLPSAYLQLIESGRVTDPTGVGAACCAVLPEVAKAIHEYEYSPLDGGG